MAISKIISSSISDNTVVAADVGPNAITASELADDAVDTAAIANDAVTGAKIENNPTIAGNLTVGGNVVIPDGGNIGSASDTNAISISSSGAVTLSSDFVPANPLSNRNIIINGDFRVNQVGNKTGITTDEKQFAGDRWTLNVNGALGTWSGGTGTSVPTGSGFRNSGYANCTTADASPASSDFVRIEQRFEGQDLQQIRKGTSSAKQVTLSFWVKSPNTGIHIVELEDKDNLRYCSQSYTIGTANTWEYKTATFPADTTGELNDDNGESLRINFWLGAGSDKTSGGSLGTTWHTTENTRAVGQVNVGGAVHSSGNYWQITGVQLELGSVATPFEHKSYADELQRCLRYTYVFSSGTEQHNHIGTNYFATRTYFKIQFPVIMRSVPSTPVSTSLIMSSYSAELTIASSQSVVVNNVSKLSSQCYVPISGTKGYVSHSDIVSGRIIFNSEL